MDARIVAGRSGRARRLIFIPLRKIDKIRLFPPAISPTAKMAAAPTPAPTSAPAPVPQGKPEKIRDIQSGRDTRAVAIDRVGIRDLKLPMLFHESRTPTPSSGVWRAYTNLPADSRGTHMSRLVLALHSACDNFSFAAFRKLPAQAAELLGADQCMLAVEFPCFVKKTAPVSAQTGYMDYDAAFLAMREKNSERFLIRVTAPVTSLCPCSKAISARGAHNQRSHVTVTLESNSETARVRDIAALIEANASCDLFSVLKRPDERHVTERAYDNPKFVEDIVRDIAVALSRESGVLEYRVEAENFESIHNHSAYAMLETPGFPAKILE